MTKTQQHNLLNDLHKRLNKDKALGFQPTDYFGSIQLRKFISENNKEKAEQWKQMIITNYINKFKKYEDIIISFEQKDLDYEMIIEVKDIYYNL